MLLMDGKRLYIRTFGCQMNEHDSEKMRMLLQAEGCILTDHPGDADIVLFNTCSVREKPHHKAISEVGRALKLKKRRPYLIVGMTGCVAQEEKNRLLDILPELDLILGPDQIFRLPQLIKQLLETRSKKVSSSINATELINNYDDYHFVFPAPPGQYPNTPTQFITVMKGCNNFCSFCIVPYVRGREVSKSPDVIIDEIKALSLNGVKEVTLLGQNVNSYGDNQRGFGTFTGLVRRISDETDILRIRYTSPHPKDLSDELIGEHKNNRKLCEHIHLPVQAGSSSVLERMNRGYTKENYLDKVYNLRKAVKGISITTDIIVGFPGETEEDFNDTLDIMKKASFDGMFAFKYSIRNGTRAAELDDDVPGTVKAQRLSQVLELNQKIVLQKNIKYVGTIQEVLVEDESRRGQGQLMGRTRDNKIVNFSGDLELIGHLVKLEIVRGGPNSLKGEIID